MFLHFGLRELSDHWVPGSGATGAEKCVRTFWVAIRITFLHWVKVILHSRCVLHTFALARRSSRRARTRRMFTAWRGMSLHAPPKEMVLSSSLLLEGNSAQGYDAWEDESSETDIDEDNDGDKGCDTQDPQHDSSDSGAEDKEDPHDKSDEREPSSPRPVVISGIDKMPSFPNLDGGRKSFDASVDAPVREVLYFSAQPSLQVTQEISNTPTVRFRALPKLAFPSPSRLSIPRYVTWLSEDDRLSIARKKFVERGAVRACAGLFYLWAAAAAAQVANASLLDAKLAVARMLLLGSSLGTAEDICAGASGLKDRISARCIASHFNDWAEEVAKQRSMRRKCSTILDRESKMWTRLVFMEWLMQAKLTKTMKNKSMWLTNKDAKMHKTQSFERWREASDHVKTMRLKCRNFVTRDGKVCLRQGFARWLLQTQCTKTMKGKVAAVLSHCMQHVRGLVFHCWFEYHLRLRHLCEGAFLATAKGQRHRVQSIFSSWHGLVSFRKVALRRVQMAFSRQVSSLLAHVMREWQRHRDRRLDLDGMRKLLTDRWQRRRLTDVVSIWYELMGVRCREQARCKVVVDRRFRRCFFLVWRGFQGAAEVRDCCTALAGSRLRRFARCLCLKRSLFSWHRHMQNGGEARFHVRLAHYRRARAIFQDLRHALVRKNLLCFLSSHMGRLTCRRALSRSLSHWRRLVSARPQGPYMVRDHISEVYLSLSPFPTRSYTNSPSIPRI